MKNIAIIFAGGTGNRMHSKSKPKQFLELNGKPIIIYTLELFDNHPDIDAIVIACIKEWIPYLEKMIRKFDIEKVVSIVPGGKDGQESIYVALCAAEKYSANEAAIVLIHDGVRPLINYETITANIEKVKECGSCITTIPAIETFIIKKDDGSFDIPERNNSMIARAPQSFILHDILSAHRKAMEEELPPFIDSCSLMSHYEIKLGMVMGPMENIKITTPTDFYILRALVEAKENQQIFGI